jgi:hypothetical protein
MHNWSLALFQRATATIQSSRCLHDLEMSDFVSVLLVLLVQSVSDTVLCHRLADTGGGDLGEKFDVAD